MDALVSQVVLVVHVVEQTTVAERLSDLQPNARERMTAGERWRGGASERERERESKRECVSLRKNQGKRGDLSVFLAVPEAH